MKTTPKTTIAFCALILAAAAGTAPAVAAPGTPPRDTGSVTPLTGDRDSSPSFPSASPATEVRCAGQTESSTPVTGIFVAPVMINGAPLPQGTARGGADWCAGAYSPAAGTNFSGR